MSARTFLKLPGGEGYTLITDEIKLQFRQLRREHHQLYAELEVECQFAPKEFRMERDGKVTISCSDLNLSSQSQRTARAKYCSDRSKTRPEDGIDWVGIVDDACQRVIVAERQGEPVIALANIAMPDLEYDHTVNGFVVPRRDTAAIVADGGKGKSTFAMYVAGELEQRGERVLFCDYETDGVSTKQKALMLFGTVPAGLFYRRCALPFIEEADTIHRDVQRLNISYAVLDSLVPACGDPAEESATAAALLRAQRAIGCGWLNIAHVSKAAERGKEKPFGSQFFWNESRSVWVLESHATNDRLVLAVHHRKCNNGPLRAAIGFELTYGPNRIDVKPCDVADTPQLADGLPMRNRIKELLRRGPLPLFELAEKLDAKPNTIAHTVRRHNLLFTRVLSADGIQRIGLVAKETL